METWHILIYAVGAVGGGLAGMLFTGLVYYLVCRFILKDPRTLGAVLHIVFTNRFNKIQPAYSTAPLNQKYRPSLQIGERLEQISPISHSPVPVREKEPVPHQTLVEPRIAISGFNIELKGIAPELMAEFEYNYKIAREFSGGDLVSLQTKIWDTSQLIVKTLPGKLQNELENTYGIIKMLNNLVWFSTEFHRQSSALSEQYTNLLTAIAGKLDELVGKQKLATSGFGPLTKGL